VRRGGSPVTATPIYHLPSTGERTPPSLHASERGPYGERCPSPEPSSTYKSPVDEPHARLPNGDPTERDALLPISVPVTLPLVPTALILSRGHWYKSILKPKAVCLTNEVAWYAASYNYYIAEIWVNINHTVKYSKFITQYAKCTFHHYSCPG
jgi:hypothetical protein